MLPPAMAVAGGEALLKCNSLCTWMCLSPHPVRWGVHGSRLSAENRRPCIPPEPSRTLADSPCFLGPSGYDSNLEHGHGAETGIIKRLTACWEDHSSNSGRGDCCTSVYSEVLQRDGGGNVSNMAELFLTDSSGGAAQRFGLSFQSEKTYRHTHKHQFSSMDAGNLPTLHSNITYMILPPGHGESSQCLMWRIFSSLERV